MLVNEMMNVLKNDIGYTTSIVLLLKGDETRFNLALQTMLHQMSALFGVRWWDFTTIAVSFWPYDQDSIDGREEECELYPESCKDEAWFQREMNSQIQEKFHVTKNFTFVFTDSWSQTKPHVDDPVEQEHWIEQTLKLWEIASTGEHFEFKTIDDTLEENQAMKEEIEWLNDVITTNISDLASQIVVSIGYILLDRQLIYFSFQHNADSISSNTGLILVVEKDLDTEVDAREVSEEALTNQINSYMESTHGYIDVAITEVEHEISNLQLAPIGSIAAWTGGIFFDLPPGWQLCDGSPIILFNPLI
jgi:hypothetical protein